jgi:CHAT domain-containing protein
LHLVPLHYLPFRGGPLVRHFSISRIHSISAVVALLRQPPVTPLNFMAAQVPAQEDRDPGKVSMLARVPQWLTERREGIALAREQATVDAVAKLDLTRRVVHFATHGTFPLRDSRERNPNPFQASGLALAKDGTLPSLARVAAGKADDTLLTPERVLNLRLDGSHVTLQACVSGLAKEGIGGDALGLELAFLLAGAQSMLTTHWNVSAAASADFSIRFYQKWLVDKLTRAQAWREAMLDLMKEETPSDLPGEYYWAGFSLSGDWR